MTLSPDQEEISSRLKAIRDDLGETQRGMDARLSLGKGGWKEFEASGRLPKPPQLQLLQQLGFSLQWLLIGFGEIRGDDSVGRPAAPPVGSGATTQKTYTVEERIEAVRTALHETPAGMDKRLFLKPGSWADAEKFGQPPRNMSAISVLERLGFSYRWVRNGDGDMMRPDAPPLPTPEPTLPASTEPFILPARFAPGSEVQPAPGIVLPHLSEMPRDLPLMGTANGSDDGAIKYFEGELDYVRRPPGLMGRREAYALNIEGMSMSPKYEPGEMVTVDPRKPVLIRDYVVIQTQDGPHAPITAYIKRLVSIATDKVTVEQFNPPKRIEFERRTVKAIHKVLSAAEERGI